MTKTITPYDVIAPASLAQEALNANHSPEDVDLYIKGFLSGYALAAAISNEEAGFESITDMAVKVAGGFVLQQEMKEEFGV